MGNLLLDLRIASRSLFQHRRRTFFLGLAIAGVTALLRSCSTPCPPGSAKP